MPHTRWAHALGKTVVLVVLVSAASIGTRHRTPGPGEPTPDVASPAGGPPSPGDDLPFSAGGAVPAHGALLGWDILLSGHR